MSALKICRICLRTEAKGYKFERYQLKYFYEEVTALKVADGDELPQWFCFECATLLHKFHKFKEKCYIGQKYLKEVLWKGPITYEAIYKLDEALKLQSTLGKITITDKVKTFTIKDIEFESNDQHENTNQNNQIHSHTHSEINYLLNSNQITLNTENYNLDTKNIHNLDTDAVINLHTKNDNNLNTDYVYVIKSVEVENVNNFITDVNILVTDVNILDDANVNNLNEGVNNLITDVNILNTNVNNLNADVNNLGTGVNNLETKNDTTRSNERDFKNACYDSTVYRNIYNDPASPISILVQGDKAVSLKTENLKPTKSKNVELSNVKELGKYLSEDNWKKIFLREDEAVKEFREKAEDPKYLDAAFKCSDCFKGFSKKDMLNRHIQSRHSEELGVYECRFCRMRFKWKCHLRKHIQQHYTRYECLRCRVIFHLDTSALLHEEYHSGTTKKCVHCSEEFHHITTYYTHMRTHRSEHVCVRCGASFVSRVGLRQHARRKHPEDQADSPSSSSEAESRESYCARCDIRFHSRRAHTEHLFHSDMHSQLTKKEHDEVKLSKKIMSKRLREKITKELRKRKSDLDTTSPVKVKRRKRIKRKHRKPSTCYQCGLEFSTQAACMKHHVAAHPRTSFHSPHDRHICELCGASLAPGSVAVHQNMHSRERVHTCESCGRQFHSAVGLKRHLVTHTGEKPFACPLCAKRFTQSNSMKLHYRTFHLKQPYPKRIRKKKKEEQNQNDQDDSYEESDSVPETVLEAPPLPDVPAAPEVPAVLHVVGENGASLEEENMHYLTLS